MNAARMAGVGAVLLAAGFVAVVLFAPGLLVGDPGSYEETTVTVRDENGSRLATVAVRIADTRGKRYTGLSETDALTTDEGMLFVHDAEKRHGYVMRNMSFPIDIVFIDANGTVRRIFHAGVDGADAPYRARAKYVLEVPRGWANATGVGTGDRVVIPEGD